MFINENGKANLDVYGKFYKEEQCYELEEIACVISNFFDGGIYEHEVDDLAILLHQNNIKNISRTRQLLYNAIRKFAQDEYEKERILSDTGLTERELDDLMAEYGKLYFIEY